MTLSRTIKNKSYIVETMQLEQTLTMRLRALGMTKGTTITILNHKKSGSVIFMVRGTRLAVGNKIAEAISVEECKEQRICEIEYY